MLTDSDLAPQREIYTPSALTRLVRDLLEDAFPLIWVEGELSNFSRPSSGHFYFSLKDAQSQIRCAMFKPKSTYLRFKPSDGLRVIARVRVSLYEARGEFQLIVEHLEEAGEGALLREFERLKAKLSAEGLFDASHKRALPSLPRRIGVITSPTGAAIRDVVSVLSRRFPMVDVEIFPVPVQGKEAPAAIVKAINAASAAKRHDVLLLTRGGGSLEDLWAFNDETIVRAMRASSIPIVSAVGHEIDFTLADFAADVRAPTPSAAAEILVPDAASISRLLDRDLARIAQCARRRSEKAAQRVDHALARLRAQHPQSRLRNGRERLAQLRARLFTGHPAAVVQKRREQLLALDRYARAVIAMRLESRALRIGQLARALNAVSPLATLQRGYAILQERDSGRTVRSPQQAPSGTVLIARVAEGEIIVRSENQ